MESFKFITNITNPCDGGQTFEKYVEKILNKEAAGIAAPYGEDSKPDKSQGQVISDKGEAGEGHQAGESVDGKSECESKTKEPKKKEAAGQAKGEDQESGIEISLPADKEFQKGESADGSKVTTKTKKTEAKSKQADKKASASQWVKISNLNAKEKTMLKQYWLTQYPREYVDAMIQDR